jgi:hypothetical protein
MKNMITAAAAITVTAGTAAASVEVYNDFYNNFNNNSSLTFGADTATWAYAVNDADGFGGIVQLDNPGNQPLVSASVIMSNWNGWDPNGLGTATASYTHDFTIELYNVDRSGANPAAGSLIASITETQTVAGRELPGVTPVSSNGTDFLMDWDLSSLNIAPAEILFIVSFDRVDDPATSFDELQALNNLNIAAVESGTAPDVTVGSSVGDEVFWRSPSFTGGDISRFEGGRVLSRFTAVPAPGAAGLLGIASLAAVRRRR